MLSKTFLIACVAAACSLTALPSVARTVWVREAPPEVRVEEVPAPRHGYQWVPGYWNWEHRRHVWHPGTWVRARHGYVYMQPTWVQRDGRWVLESGHWRRHNRDRDGDGVPNREDRRPNDPTRQ
jgi:hypothetical protein